MFNNGIKNKENYNENIFLTIYIIGAFSGFFSFVYLNICFCRFQKNSEFKIKKIIFFYFETSAILVMHSFFIYNFFYVISSRREMGDNLGRKMGMIAIFFLQVFLFIINFFYFIFIHDKNIHIICCKTISTSLKLFFYIDVEWVLFDTFDNLINGYRIFFTARIVFMIVSIITLSVF